MLVKIWSQNVFQIFILSIGYRKQLSAILRAASMAYAVYHEGLEII